MSRYDDLKKAICKDPDDELFLGPTIAHVVALEERMDYLLTLPQIKIHPKDPTKQKTLPAHRQYKELLQQYSNIIKALSRRNGEEAENDESPLRAWFRQRMEKQNANYE